MIEKGIFEKLRESGKDPLNYVFVTSLSLYENNAALHSSKLIDGNIDTYFHSKSGVGQWVFFNFCARHLKIKGFFVTPTYNRGPLHWKLEGTNNGTNFEPVFENDGVSMCELRTDKYCSEKKKNKYLLNHSVTYSGYRFITTGTCSKPGDEWLVLTEIDFIGDFVLNLKTCFCRKSNIITRIYYLILIIS